MDLNVRGIPLDEQKEKRKKASNVKMEIIEKLKETDFTVNDCIAILDDAKTTIQSVSKGQTIKSLDF